MEKQPLTHFDPDGNAIMVDVGQKKPTDRQAVATGYIKVSQPVFLAVQNQNIAKGDVLGVARIAGIMAAKKTWDLIPLCHPLPIYKCNIDFSLDDENCCIHATCLVKVHAVTGVEMEALTGVNITLLTIYDMCKGMDKSMEISGIHLVKKTGGKSGTFLYEK